MSKQKQNQSKGKRVTRKVSRKALLQRIGIGVGALVIALGAITVMSLYAKQRSNSNQVENRLNRIQAIYDAVSVGDSARVVRSNVFGDKRPYEIGGGRTYSSSVTYAYPDTVPNTLAAYNTKVTAAGFTFIDEPYPGDPAHLQYHYRSENGEYIRLSVWSKTYADAYENALIMGDDSPWTTLQSLDDTAAPSYVTVKVNLDDNNE